MSDCICETEFLPANATRDTPYFTGIRRFPSTKLVKVDADCVVHGYMTHPDYHPAADLRYGD